MKKVTNKFGRLKDYLKGIICLGVGVILIIFGFVWLQILPLAIVFFVLGCPAALTGLGLIIHNKKNNTVVYNENASSSGSSTSSSTSSADGWEQKFVSAIENYPYGAYKTARASASYYDNKIKVNVTIEYCGSNIPSIQESNLNDMSAKVKKAYSSMAKKCPHSSTLNISIK